MSAFRISAAKSETLGTFDLVFGAVLPGGTVSFKLTSTKMFGCHDNCMVYVDLCMSSNQ